MSLEITPELIANIATLSRLDLSAEESAELRGHFEKVLRFVEKLDALDLDDVDPSIFPLETVNVLRPDEAGSSSLGADEATRNAPDARDGFFLVPRIIQEA